MTQYFNHILYKKLFSGLLVSASALILFGCSSTPTTKIGEPSESLSKKSSLERVIGHNREGERALKPLISKYAAQNGIPYDLANAVVRIESRFNPAARNGPYYGLSQISITTARSLGFSGDPSGLLNPETNLRYGMNYLGTAYKLANGDLCGTILRYQGGHRAKTMTSAAQTYCNKVKMIFADK